VRNPREKSRAIENLAIGVRFRVFSFVPMRRGRVRLAETLSLAGTIWSPRACGMSSNPEFETAFDASCSSPRGNWPRKLRRPYTKLPKRTGFPTANPSCSPTGSLCSPSRAGATNFSPASPDLPISGSSHYSFQCGRGGGGCRSGCGCSVGLGGGLESSSHSGAHKSPSLYSPRVSTRPSTSLGDKNPLPTGGITRSPIIASASDNVCWIQLPSAPLAMFSFAAIS
jgi:hypothetical protein